MLQQFAAKRGDQESLLDSMNSKYYYYTRTKGLFRICYPKERPPTGKSITAQWRPVLVGSDFAVFSLQHFRKASFQCHSTNASFSISSVGRDSSVGIVTRYGLEDLGIEFWRGRDFPHPPRPALGPTHPPIKWVLGPFFGDKTAGAWR